MIRKHLGALLTVDDEELVLRVIVQSPLGSDGPVAAVTVTLSHDQLKCFTI